MSQQTEEVTTTTVTKSENTQKDTRYAVVYQVIDIIQYLINGSILLRVVFKLIGANPGSGFVVFLYQLTDILLAPFRFLVPQVSVSEYVLEVSSFVAILVYYLLGVLVKKIVSTVYVADNG